jgi:hypothetical protein
MEGEETDKRAETEQENEEDRACFSIRQRREFCLRAQGFEVEGQSTDRR